MAAGIHHLRAARGLAIVGGLFGALYLRLPRSAHGNVRGVLVLGHVVSWPGIDDMGVRSQYGITQTAYVALPYARRGIASRRKLVTIEDQELAVSGTRHAA